MRHTISARLRLACGAESARRVLGACLLGVWVLAGAHAAAATELRVADQPGAGSFPLVGTDGTTAAVLVDVGDARVVRIVADAFAGDVKRVTGHEPRVVTDPAQAAPATVIAGTLGHSAIIDRLAREKKFEVSALAGTWETFQIQLVANPLPGVAQGLVVVGSDRRGTAYGLFELSRRIGVSPWVWWADAVPATQSALYLTGGMQSKPPAVKYRGIFLNDEDWGLKPWAANTFEPEVKDIGPKTYAAIFELLLRLRANHCWPAMHKCTKSFNFYPRNKEVADDYAIVMGSSHCEQMLRNNVDEWERDGAGPWDWGQNQDKVLEYWRARVAANGRYESVWTLGMRGIHDSAMVGAEDINTKVRRMEDIFAAQRELLAKYIKPDVAAVPQVLIPYKEVLDIYRGGLRVPDDVTLVWPDDNHGWLRHVPDAAEQARAGGGGVYYHISFLGLPIDYVWLDSTAPAKIYHEMSKALENHCDRLWIVNVGDIKPMEWGMSYFLDLAWDPTRPELADQPAWLAAFARENFGPELAAEIAGIRDAYYRLNVRNRPEHVSNEKSWRDLKLHDTVFSAWTDGDEIATRLDAWAALEQRAAALEARVPKNLRDAYYQLVLYPVRGAAAQNEKIFAAWRSRKAAELGLPVARQWADRAEAAHRRILEATSLYNETMAGGKWRGMMTYKMPKAAAGLPQIGKVKAEQTPRLVVLAEGDGKPVAAKAVLPCITQGAAERRFIDLHSTGLAAVPVNITTSQPWISLDRTPAAVGAWERLWVSVDWATAPAAGTGVVRIVSKNAEIALEVRAEALPKGLPPGTVAVLDGTARLLSAQAARRDGTTMRWNLVDGLGWDGLACAALRPTSAAPLNDLAALRNTAATLAWRVQLPECATIKVRLHAPPTQPFDAQHRLRCAVALDDAAPVWLEIKVDDESGEWIKVKAADGWTKRVLTSRMTGETTLPAQAGLHTITIFGTDPSISVETVELQVEK